jgi:hypothetical protein
VYKQYDVARTAYESGQVSTSEKDAAEIQVYEARAELTKIELRARYLLGADVAEAGKAEAPAGASPADSFGATAPREVLQMLDTHVYTEHWSGQSLEAVVADIQKVAGFVVVVDPMASRNSDFVSRQVPEGAFPKQMRLRAALQALTDFMGNDPVFVIRDYGLLVTTRTIAESKGYAPTIPPLPPRAGR